jgi:N-acetylmuramoyl-L-alanine amidase
MALESRPDAERTREEYERVLNAYRAIYHCDPGASKADASIYAVAELLAEEGRLFAEKKSLHDAAGQYEFLRRNYPYSRYRFSALITEGEMYGNDIGDRAQAKAEFEEFLKDYPRNSLAAEARAELKKIRDEDNRDRASGESQPAPETYKPETRKMRRVEQAAGLAGSSAPDSAVMANQAPLQKPIETEPARKGSALAAQAEQTGGETQRAESGSPSSETPLPDVTLSNAAFTDTASPHRSRLPQVTGIRYWSTSLYTRIAIDLEDQVEYQAARVPNPDRIYFDLRDARLAPELMGKSVAVADDAFLKRIRAAQFSNDVTRIVLDVNPVADYSAFFLPNPWRLIIDVHGRQAAGTATTPQALVPMPVQMPVSGAASSSSPSMSAAAFATAAPVHKPGTQAHNELANLDASLAALSVPDSAQSPFGASAASGTSSAPEPPSVREATPTADGGRSLVRALGLKIGRIVIDPGHGGHDSGTLGPGGVQEKDVVLDVALRLGKLLHERLGAEVVYTRTDDTFVPLETRTAVANQAQADLFISIHANSSPDQTARGVETYYLNFTTSTEALEVAARENAGSDGSIHELSDLVKEIALKDKIEESQEFAGDVQKSLYRGLEPGNPGLKDRGVKKAPFVVLIGANMPSILAEISFLTNPGDARELRQPAYRERIAESLYRGTSKYISGLSGLRLAQNSAESRSH